MRFGLTTTNGLFLNASPHTTPARSGKSISLRETWMSLFEAQQFSGITKIEAHQLVAEIELWGAKPSVIRDIFKILANKPAEQPKPSESVPGILLDGYEFGVVDTVFRKLDMNDMRLFFIGKHTDCCEWVGGGYEGYNGTPKDVYETRKSDFYVIEDTQTGEILAHSWVWRGTNGDLVFDGFETSKQSDVTSEDIYRAINLAIERFKDIEFDPYQIRNVYLGKCGTYVSDLKSLFPKAMVTHATPIIRTEIGANIHNNEPSLLHVGSVGTIPRSRSLVERKMDNL